jgi:hypothetical protein
MTYYDDLAVQFPNPRLQLHDLPISIRATTYDGSSTPRIEMIIGDWYLDEFGNRSREIKARN